MANRYLGPIQVAECQRCGQKGPASQLVRDGRNPSLLVFPDCWDPRDPLEQPIEFSETEGMAREPIGPQQLPETPPVLTAVLIDGAVHLTWTAANTVRARVASYRVYRSTDGGDFEALADFPISYGAAPRYTIGAPTLSDTDATVSAGHNYVYRVDATQDPTGAIPSNTSEVDIAPPPPGYTFTSGSRGNFGTLETGIDKGHTLSSGTQTYGVEVGNTTGLAICKVNQEVLSGLPSAFAIAVDGTVTQDAFTSVTFVSDLGSVTFLSANAGFGTDVGPNGAYGEWVWAAPNGNLYFTDGQSYTLTVT